MSEGSRDTITCSNQNELGPNYLGYYKQLVLELFSQNEDFPFPFLGLDHETSSVGTCSKVEDVCNHGKNREVNSRSDSMPPFTGGIGDVLFEFKKERLKVILNQSTISLNQEVDEILDQILAVFQIESDLREKELMSCFSSPSDEDITETRRIKKRKATSPISDSPGSCDGISDSQSLRQVYHEIQALQGNDEVCDEAVEKYSVEICSKLGKVEQDLEEFLNIVVSKCRAMTAAEKQLLGQQIQKLPQKALGRVVEIIQIRDLSTRNLSDNIFVNLEEQDNVTLWRLHYYVQTVLEANKI